jgi:outer membrane protein assembly factor BamB
MGQTDEKNLPIKWGGKNDENILWKAPLFPSDKLKRDHNQSSPIVWGERVFVTLTHWPEGTTDKDFPVHRVVCFSTKDGAKLWETAIDHGPWKVSDFRGGGYNCPTPATDGTNVYAIFGSSVIAAVDFQGKIAWRKDIVPHNFDVCWGASPIVYKDTLLVVCDHLKSKKSSSIYCFDGKSGEVRWECKRPVDWTHATPLLATINGKLQLITATHNGPHGLDPDTGETLWSFHMNNQIGDTVSPIVRDGLLYIDSGRGSMGVCIDATGKGDVSKTALKWKLPTVPEGFSSPVLVGDYLYRLHTPGTLSCFDWKTGEKLFSERLDGVDHAISPIATADGRIYVASAGKSYVLKAGPKPDVLAINTLGDANRASPAVAAGRIYLKGARYLWCLGTK